MRAPLLDPDWDNDDDVIPMPHVPEDYRETVAYTAGMRGYHMRRSNPHTPGTTDHVIWQLGYLDAMEGL